MSRELKANKESAARPREYDPIRGAAVLALTAYESEGETFADTLARSQSLVEMDARDNRFLLRLVNGVTKLRRKLDYQLRFYLARPSEKLASKLQNILRLGLYQIQYTDRTPDAAIVDESVKLARYFFGEPKARMVNAVLRAYLREPNKTVYADPEEEPAKHLADKHSFPEYFVQHCLQEFGVNATESYLQSLNEPPTLTVRVNLLKTKTDAITEELKKREIVFHKGRFLDEFYTLEDAQISQIRDLLDDGLIYIQDQSAGMAVRLLNPRPGVTLLDLAAAPGGKTTYAASRMRGKGKIVAIDKSNRRLELLVENAQRMKIKIISPVVCDAIQFEPEERFERVIIDPPCSGWGTARKHPELRWEKSEEDIQQMCKIQRRMLEKGASLLKPGGILVYSTCTIMRKENDQIVEEFLVKNKEFSLESADEFFDSSVVSERGFLKTYPNIPLLDGGFAARIKRKPN